MQKDGFTSKIGFVLAAAGSAVGLGNIWRFPYLAAQHGGGIFLFTYLVLVLTFGYALLISENTIGRMTGKGPIGAYRDLCAGKKSFLGSIRIGGWINAIVPLIIVPYYCVIGGWVTKYVFAMALNPVAMFEKSADSGAYFTAFITSNWSPILFFLLFMLLTVGVVALGVEKGVERFSKILMPILVILIIGICIYCMFLPGAGHGIRYYLKPDWSKFSYMTVVAAMGQLFYSMSLAMGIMITFGSYMKREISIEKSVKQIEIFDTGVAFLAGLMIIPAVFAFSGGNEAALGQGPGLMFVTLPKIFDTMPGGAVVGAAFFVMVFFAALTSSISLMETVVSIFMDKLKLGRKMSILAVLGISLVLGLVSSLGYSSWADIKVLGMQFLDFFDFFSNSLLMPVVALVTSIFVGFVLKPKTVIEEVELTEKFNSKRLFTVVIRYVAPVCILIILGSSILSAFGIVSI